MAFLARRVWWLLLIDGALALGFVMTYVFSAYELYPERFKPENIIRMDEIDRNRNLPSVI